MRLPLLLGCCLVAAACATPVPDAPAPPVPTPLTAEELEAVKAVDAAFAAAVNAKDTAALLAVYTPDALVLSPDSPILEGAEARPAILDLLARGATDVVLTATAAYGVGDVAYLVGNTTFRIGEMSYRSKYTEVLRKGADGKWRYAVDMFSRAAPPVPTAAALR